MGSSALGRSVNSDLYSAVWVKLKGKDFEKFTFYIKLIDVRRKS